MDRCRMDGCRTDGWMDGLMDGWIDGWIDRQKTTIDFGQGSSLQFQL